MRKHLFLGWFSYCLLLLPFTVLGETYVSGEVSGEWYPSGNPYVVQNTIVVGPGTSLKIYNGVEVLFLGGDSLKVYGTLEVEGVRGDSVYFYSASTTTWFGIWFLTGSLNSSYIRYASIQKPLWGIQTEHAAPTIQHSTIYALSYGIKASYSDFLMEDCVIHVDTGNIYGIYMRESSPYIRDCTIYAYNTTENGETHGLAAYNSDPTVRYCDFFVDGLEWSYGFYLENVDKGNFLYNLLWVQDKVYAVGMNLNHCAYPTFTNMTVAIKSDYEADIGAYLWNNSNPFYMNCIFYGDGTSSGIWATDYCYPEIFYTDVFNNTEDTVNCSLGVGCISANPQFMSIEDDDFRLRIDSPCIDAGNPGSTFDPDTTVADMGRFYYDQSPHVSVTSPSSQNAPHDFYLIEAYPNPFNAAVSLNFNLPHESEGRLVIYDLNGRQVQSLAEGIFNPGLHTFTWQADRAVSGIYLAALEFQGTKHIKRILLLK